MADFFLELCKKRALITYETPVTQSYSYWGRRAADRRAAQAQGLDYTPPKVAAGVRRLYEMRNSFMNAGISWQPYQSEVFDSFLNVLIRQILGNDESEWLAEVMERSGWTEFPNEELVVAPRGSGKSALMSVAVAIFLLYIPKCSIMLYSGKLQKGNDLFNSIQAMCVQINTQSRLDCTIHRRGTTLTISDATGERVMNVASSFGLVC